jgi:hypothetical protein
MLHLIILSEEKIIKMNTRALEQLDLGLGEKLHLLLTGAGAKPSSVIRYVGKNRDHTGENIVITNSELEELIEQLDLVGTPYQIGNVETIYPSSKINFETNMPKSIEKLWIYVGQTRELVSKVRKLFNERPILPQVSREIDYALGICLGYPETAVQSFINFPADYPVSLCTRERIEPSLSPFVLFAPSEEHLEEELELAKFWKNITQMQSPLVYQQIGSVR